MSLNTYVSELRLRIFEELKGGLTPSVGEFSEEALKEGRVKGAPQMGATHFEPDAIFLEFIYPDPRSTATILSVKVQAPERIVFLPVPSWVVESIWQGDIDGSYHFESEANDLVEAFRSGLSADQNQEWFGKRQPKRRE